jgi:DNA-binding MarR family transcriptional regulator
VPRRRFPGRPPASTPPAGTLDSVDHLVAEWRTVRPDLDFEPVETVSRIRRARAFLDVALEDALAAFGLSGPIFAVLSALRRQGPPFELNQRALMDRLDLTSGTVSVRVDHLAQLGLVTRRPDPADRRGALVHLTERGLEQCDACTPAYLAEEQRLLSALTTAEQAVLVGLLRRLLVGFEQPPDPATAELGLSLAPAHVARQRQRELGLAERSGLLVRSVEPGGLAEQAGLSVGDLLVRVDDRDLHSVLTLSEAAAAALAGGADGCLRLGVTHGAQAEREVLLSLRRVDVARSRALRP